MRRKKGQLHIRQPNGYQLRHKEYGVYQGSCMGFGFWYPVSGMPEQGYCEFPTKKDVFEYIKFLCSGKCHQPMKREDLSVEPFDVMESNELMRLGLYVILCQN